MINKIKRIYEVSTFLQCSLNFEKLFLFLKVALYTQSNYKRLSNVYELAKTIEQSKIEGSFVECGVWRGGASAVMAYISHKFQSRRKIWLFDSFEGMPEPTEIDGEFAKQLAKGRISGRLVSIDVNVAKLEKVQELFFKNFRFNKDNIVFQKGWFQNILPIYKDKIGDISLLKIDVDWYESTKCCLDNLYDNIIKGGYIIIDDYGIFPACKFAVDEFLKVRGLKINFKKIDNYGVYFRKP